jgi:hypothetical protein
MLYFVAYSCNADFGLGIYLDSLSVGHSSRNMEVSGAESNAYYDILAQEVSEEKDISK